MEQGILFKITTVTIGTPKVMIIIPGVGDGMGRGDGPDGESKYIYILVTAEVNRRLKTSKLRNIKKVCYFELETTTR